MTFSLTRLNPPPLYPGNPFDNRSRPVDTEMNVVSDCLIRNRAHRGLKKKRGEDGG
jgi:hypothetical protein